MKSLIKIAIVIIIAIIIISSVYVVFYMDEKDVNNHNHNGNNNSTDDIPPTIDSITGDITVNSGEKAKISVTFSDNVEVTKATIFYKTTGGELKSGDILSGTYTIDIPSDSTKDWYYYVTVDDEAGNGPVGEPAADGSKFYTITVIVENGNDNNSTKHIVFLEETTATTCKYCVNVAEVLYTLYENQNPDDPDFYYVSLVDDESSKAKKRAVDELKRVVNPTVYIDGGFKVIVGFIEDYENKLKQNILSATNRDLPQLIINLNAKWNDTRSELTTEVTIKNNEASTYKGNLRVYISEIQSRWIDHADDPFHFAFIDYSINEDISITSGENKSFSVIWNAIEADFADIYPENIQVFAVVFNSEKNQGYLNPPNENPFDAYYADAVTTAKVREGTLPPTIGITLPKEQFRHIFGLFNMRTWITKRTVLIGRGTIEVSVLAEAGVDRVEFYIDGDLRYNMTEGPYSWTFRTIGSFKRLIIPGKHTIEVKLIDKENRVATDSINVITFFL